MLLASQEAELVVEMAVRLWLALIDEPSKAKLLVLQRDL